MSHPTLASCLDRLISGRAVRPVFQPIVNLRTGRVAGYEALTRPNPESGFSDAGILFDVAQTLERLWDLESVTRHATLDAASTMLPVGARLFMNCTPQVVADDRFDAETLRDEVERAGLDPARIVIEITERADDAISDELIEHAQHLMRVGFEVAIDDVGAGANGLVRLLAVRPRWLKLDRELIDMLDHDPYRRHLVEALHAFAKRSDVRIVAEGIEREPELETLREIGIECAQGYFLGRPDAEMRDVTLPSLTPSTESMPDPLPVDLPLKPVVVVDAGTPVDDLASTTTDVVAVHHGRIVGLCPASLLQHAFGRSLRVGALARPLPLVDASTGTAEILDAIAHTSHPCLVVRGSTVEGWIDTSSLALGLRSALGYDADPAGRLASTLRDLGSQGPVEGALVGVPRADLALPLLRDDAIRFVSSIDEDRILVAAAPGTLLARLRVVVESCAGAKALLVTDILDGDPERLLDDLASLWTRAPDGWSVAVASRRTGSVLGVQQEALRASA